MMSTYHAALDGVRVQSFTHGRVAPRAHINRGTLTSLLLKFTGFTELVGVSRVDRASRVCRVSRVRRFSRVSRAIKVRRVSRISSGVTVSLQWCDSDVAVLLQCCYSIVTVVLPSEWCRPSPPICCLHICDSGVTVVLQRYLRRVTVVLQWCYSGATVFAVSISIASTKASACELLRGYSRL
jgi:hypothetical protein